MRERDGGGAGADPDGGRTGSDPDGSTGAGPAASAGAGPDASAASGRSVPGYTLAERLPTVDEFVALREAAGMAARSRVAVERGLPNSRFAVVAVHDDTGETVGMGRVVGDGGSVFHVCDMAVHPDHQRRGLGTRIMGAITAYLDGTAPPGAYVNLFADVDGFYERFGFEESRPASKGMYRRIE